jgi:16S rRNA (uracil1498-N3)-methyltransferase
MRLHRFFVEAPLDAGPIVSIKDRDLCHQITRVLRLERGDALILLDGNGHEARGEIITITPKHIEVRIGERSEVEIKPQRTVTLCCAVLKRENFSMVVQKATEVGVATIIPIITSRTIKTGINIERLRAIAREAAEQSGRGTIPKIEEHLAFEKAVEVYGKNGEQWFLHTSKNEALEKGKKNESAVTCWIGPEGGWTDEEVKFALTKGLRAISLGSMVLRAETAAIITAYLAIQPKYEMD